MESQSGTGTTVYTYYPSGLRASKTVGGVRIDFVLDGGNVVLEHATGTITAKYIRGINLISSVTGGTTKYYLYNAHGDVVQLTDSSGAVIKTYDYDAFGNEKNIDVNDTNPFRYSGEYFDRETGTYYLRARYYDPAIGRFTSEDPHWNPRNMVYGDDPLKLNNYTFIPDFEAIMQSGNLYVYSINNPIMYQDPDGKIIITTTVLLIVGGAALFGTAGGFVGNHIAKKNNVAQEDRWKYVVGGVAIGATGGGALGLVAAPAVITATGIGGISVTASGVSVTIFSGGQTVVIGETMRRVTEYASRIDAKTYQGLFNYKDVAAKHGPIVADFLGKVDNAKWLLGEMMRNSKIVDIGIDLGRASWSSSYLMERILTFFYQNKEIVNKLVK